MEQKGPNAMRSQTQSNAADPVIRSAGIHLVQRGADCPDAPRRSGRAAQRGRNLRPRQMRTLAAASLAGPLLWVLHAVWQYLHPAAFHPGWLRSH